MLRANDGYVNATALCKAVGKDWFDYRRLKVTEAFITELCAETGIPGTELIQSVVGGNPKLQGTWVNPQVAINIDTIMCTKLLILLNIFSYKQFKESVFILALKREKKSSPAKKEKKLAVVEKKKASNVKVAASNETLMDGETGDDSTISKEGKAPEVSVSADEDGGLPRDYSEDRDKRGRFAPGNKIDRLPKAISPANIKNYKALIAEGIPAIIEKLMDIAFGRPCEGDKEVLMYLLNKVVSNPKPATYIDAPFSPNDVNTLKGIKKVGQEISMLMRSGDMTVEDTNEVYDTLETQKAFIEAADIEPRMAEIEQAINSQRNKS